MKNGWNIRDADNYLKKYGAAWGDDLSLLAYATRLVGGIPELAMHGGGNTSCKGVFKTASGETLPALFIKPSGADMGLVSPPDFIPMRLDYLKKLRFRHMHQDATITKEYGKHTLGTSTSSPSIETPMHAFLEKKFIIHTHPSAILILANRRDGEDVVNDVLGEDAGFIPYASLGFHLGRAVAAESERKTNPPGIVLAQHGLVTMGDTAEEAYDKTIACVSRAEEYLIRSVSRTIPLHGITTVRQAVERYTMYREMFAEILSLQSDGSAEPPVRMELSHLVSEKVLARLDFPAAAEIFCTAPLNPDHLLRIKIRPLYVKNPDYDHPDILRRQIDEEKVIYQTEYSAYINKHSAKLDGLCPPPYAFLPRVLLLPGIGAVCAAPNMQTAAIYRDMIGQSIEVKSAIYQTGGRYSGLSQSDAFDMERRIWQKTLGHA
jgi:rhamnose utilization protein RhaD (predicted bifunctional aldolase and dehydrogenase)